jgi:hypothetical protein
MNPSPDFAFVRLNILASIPKEDFEQKENVSNLLYSIPRNVIIYLFRDKRDIYISLTKGLFKSAGIILSHFSSMLPSPLKYLYSVKPVRMHFPEKQARTNDALCNAVTVIPADLKRPFVSGTYMSRWSRKGEIVWFHFVHAYPNIFSLPF